MSASSCFRPAALALAAIALLQGCATRVEPLRPEVKLPQQWSPGSEGRSDAAVDPQWWGRFGSAELSGLVRQALEQAPDMKTAIERVRQAEFQARIAGASLYPSLNLSGGTNWRRSDPAGRTPATDSNGSSLSLGASYELDLWGGVAADIDSAQAGLKATRLDFETARLSLAAGVATGYFQLLSARMRLAIARENLAIAERVLKVVQVRQRNGVASTLDLVRQESTVLAQRQSLLSLELQEKQAHSALALLAGRTAADLPVQAADLKPLAVPRPAPGLPSHLLARRPDLAAQEARLVAADADLRAARAALLPGIQLTGSAGLSTAALLSLANPSTSLGLGASVTQSIFDAGRLRAQASITESRRVELVEGYRKAILTAFKEADDALQAAGRLERQEALQEQVRERAAHALQLSELRYREGADDLLTMLDAQRTLFSAQDQLAQLRLSRLAGAVDLYKVLGGGWTPQAD